MSHLQKLMSIPNAKPPDSFGVGQLALRNSEGAASGISLSLFLLSAWRGLHRTASHVVNLIDR